MIRAATWFTPHHHGVYAPGGESWQMPMPADMPSLIGRPVRNFQRLTGEAWFCLSAASLAMKAAELEKREIGLLFAGSKGGLLANRNYFRDYVENGRTLGRGNLFIYTLPTSVSGEVAIALALTGPCLFIQNDSRPLPSLIEHAEQMLADGEADAMLLFWSDPIAAVCLAIEKGDDARKFPIGLDLNPLDLCQQLQQLVRGA